MRRVFFFAVPLYFVGDVVDESAEGFRLDNASIVYETGNMPECFDTQKFKDEQKIGDRVTVMRGTIIATKELSK